LLSLTPTLFFEAFNIFFGCSFPDNKAINLDKFWPKDGAIANGFFKISDTADSRNNVYTGTIVPFRQFWN
jgi:hypothetical protein